MDGSTPDTYDFLLEMAARDPDPTPDFPREPTNKELDREIEDKRRTLMSLERRVGETEEKLRLRALELVKAHEDLELVIKHRKFWGWVLFFLLLAPLVSIPVFLLGAIWLESWKMFWTAIVMIPVSIVAYRMID